MLPLARRHIELENIIQSKHAKRITESEIFFREIEVLQLAE
jgi:hypothetical protein